MKTELRKSNLEGARAMFGPFISEIEKSFYEVFPNGFMSIGIVQSIGSPFLSVHFGMIGDDKDQSHGYKDNDPMQHKMIGFFAGDDYYSTVLLDEKIALESLISGISINPPKDSYLAMGRVKTSFRKSTMSIEKQVPKFKKYFSKIGALVLENKDNLYKKDIKAKYLDIRP